MCGFAVKEQKYRAAGLLDPKVNLSAIIKQTSLEAGTKPGGEGGSVFFFPMNWFIKRRRETHNRNYQCYTHALEYFHCFLWYTHLPDLTFPRVAKDGPFCHDKERTNMQICKYAELSSLASGIHPFT